MPEDHITDHEMKSQQPDLVFLGAKVPSQLAAAFKARAKREDRPVAAQIRIALAEHIGYIEEAAA